MTNVETRLDSYEKLLFERLRVCTRVKSQKLYILVSLLVCLLAFNQRFLIRCAIKSPIN